MAATAAASPAPGTVEVRDQAGGLITTTSGADAVHDALAVVATQRLGDATPWAVFAGAGTYGDFAVSVRNVTVAADPAGSVTISGAGTTDVTSGRCVNITRGNVTLTGFTCATTTKGSGVNVSLPNSEGGVVVSGMSIDAPAADGVTVTGGTGIVLSDIKVTSPKRSGFRLSQLTAQGPYAITGGSVAGAAANGLHLVTDVTKLQVTGLSISGSKGAGVLGNDSGNSDDTFQGVRVSGSSGDGFSLGGGALRVAIRDSVATGNTGAGIRLADGTGFAVSGVTLDGTNQGGDLLFTADDRTGGTYTGLQAGGGFSVVGEPYAVRLSQATQGVPASAGGRNRSGAGLAIAATASTARRRLVVRWDARGTVYRGAGKWSAVKTSRRIKGGAQALLGTSYLGTSAALYAPFG